MADKPKRIEYVIEINDKGKIKIENLTKGFVKASTAVKNLNKDLAAQTTVMKENNRVNQNMIDKTGLAGAVLVEFGRTASDFNYGIRGMANNLSQLSTLFITLISTTGGFGEAIEALKQSFRGPLGFIVLFQLVITAIERFDMQSRKAKENIDNISGASASAGMNLKLLRDAVNNGTISTEELERAVNKANLEYKDLNLKLQDNKKFTEESALAIDEKIKALERLAKANAIVGEIEKISGELAKLQTEETKALAETENKTAMARIQAVLATRGAIGEEANKIQKSLLEASKEATKQSFKEQRDELQKEIDLLVGILNEENLFDETFGGKASGLGPKTKLKLLEFDSELKNFFLDVDKNGNAILVKGINNIQNMYDPLFESSEQGMNQLKRLGEDFNDIQKSNQENLKAGLKFIKDQARDVTDLFKATQQSLKFVGDSILSYHDARMESLRRERDYVLQSGALTGAAQRRAIQDIEKREMKAQQRKIKAERDLFTIKQSLLIAEEVMKIKADFAERKRQFEQNITYFKFAQGRIIAKSAESIGDAQFSLGEFVRQLGPIGIATYAVTIGGLIASILSARKKAQAALSSLGAPSAGGGGGAGIDAPDFNVVGASPQSQLAQSIAGSKEKPLRAFVVHKDIKNAAMIDDMIIDAAGT